MTTIAFHKESMTIAFDSRKTKGGFIANDNHNKAMTAGNGDVLILAGDNGEIERVVGAWPDLIEASSCCGFAITGGDVSWLSGSDGVIGIESCDHNETAGSGDAYAIAAMDHGKSAEEAVKYAMTRDVYTGGKIHTIKVK